MSTKQVVSVNEHYDSGICVRDRHDPTETVERFQDIKADLREQMPFEVTNQFVLDILCDVYALHQEDPA